MASANTLVIAYENYKRIKRNFAANPLANIAACYGICLAR